VRVDENVGDDEIALKDDEVVSRTNALAGDGKTTVRIVPVKAFISQGYWIGRFEVTQREWRTAMATERWKEQRHEKEGDDLAETYIRWHDAMAFCRKLTTQERQAEGGHRCL